MSGVNKGISEKEKGEEAVWAKKQVICTPIHTLLHYSIDINIISCLQEAEKLKKLAKELASKEKKDDDTK